jgi:hypothetical protein
MLRLVRLSLLAFLLACREPLQYCMRDGFSRRDGRRCKVCFLFLSLEHPRSDPCQGFGRRYFTLYQSGLLSYSFEPGQPTRDQISLHQAAISTAPGRKDIHIDSNTATFHIKCLNSDDFVKWMAAFRSNLHLLMTERSWSDHVCQAESS